MGNILVWIAPKGQEVNTITRKKFLVWSYWQFAMLAITLPLLMSGSAGQTTRVVFEKINVFKRSISLI